MGIGKIFSLYVVTRLISHIQGRNLRCRCWRQSRTYTDSRTCSSALYLLWHAKRGRLSYSWMIYNVRRTLWHSKYTLATIPTYTRIVNTLVGADSNTLNLLLALLTNREASHTRYLLIVGAYRDNEVSESHPLSLALREIRSKGGMVEDVSVLALDEEQVVQLLEDTFNANQSMSRGER